MRNMLPWMVLLAGMSLLAATPARATGVHAATSHGEPLPRCAPGQLSGVWPDAQQVSRHRTFRLPAIGYPPQTHPTRWGMPLQLLVDPHGRVTCFVINPVNPRLPFVMNARRRKLLATVTSWRYRPFRRHGKAVWAVVNEYIYEQHLPDPMLSHRAPHVPLGDVTSALPVGARVGGVAAGLHRHHQRSHARKSNDRVAAAAGGPALATRCR